MHLKIDCFFTDWNVFIYLDLICTAYIDKRFWSKNHPAMKRIYFIPSYRWCCFAYGMQKPTGKYHNWFEEKPVAQQKMKIIVGFHKIRSVSKGLKISLIIRRTKKYAYWKYLRHDWNHRKLKMSARNSLFYVDYAIFLCLEPICPALTALLYEAEIHNRYKTIVYLLWYMFWSIANLVDIASSVLFYRWRHRCQKAYSWPPSRWYARPGWCCSVQRGCVIAGASRCGMTRIT